MKKNRLRTNLNIDVVLSVHLQWPDILLIFSRIIINGVKMAISKKDLVRQLDGVINRLEDNVLERILSFDRDEADLQDEELDLGEEGSEEIEGTDAAMIIMERRMEELAQILGEEIENLRRLLEKIEDGD